MHCHQHDIVQAVPIESLVTYGTVQLFLRNHSEAIKSAETVVELSIEDNPRLLTVGT